MTPNGGSVSNLARYFHQLRGAVICWALVVLILGIQALVMAMGGPELQPARSWYEEFGLSQEGVFSGKVWQLLSYGLLHGDWWHVGLNALFLLLIGPRIEHMAGRSVLLKAASFGVLGGAIGHLVLTPGGMGAPLLVGFSGGCMGLLLLLTTLSPQSRMMPLPVSGKSLGLGLLLAELTLALADPTLNMPVLSDLGKWLVNQGMGGLFQMGHACHFGGGMAGWFYGRWLLRPRVTLEHLQRDRKRREVD